MNDKVKPMLIAVMIGLSACGGASAVPDTPEQPTTTTSQPPVAISDGEHFGYVIVANSDNGFELQFDDAVMLSGEEAHDAAVEAGVISADEVLPNDFFIVNDEPTLVEIPLADDAEIEVISADDTSSMIEVAGSELMALFTDTYDGPPVYGIVPGGPIPMDIDVVDGVVVSAHAVYLP